MKKMFLKIFDSLLQRKRFRFFLVNHILSKHKDDALNTQLLHQLKGDILKELFQYPSIINDGYLHINRTIEILKSCNIAGKFILDIGAAEGQTCIVFAKAFPAKKIIGFEPIDETFNHLKNSTKDFSNIEVHHTALGKEKVITEINVMNRITSSSLFSSNQNTSNDNKYFDIERKEKINIDKLDDYGFATEGISLIKMDVQGFELEVLKGAELTLSSVNFILLEMQNHEIYIDAPKYYKLDEHLRNKGFELFDLIPSIRKKDGQIFEYDALYINKQLSA